jgi:hypothetical protein
VTAEVDGPYSPDATDDGADWIKAGSWDIPATNIDELRAYLASAGWTVEQFKQLPVYRWHLEDQPWLGDLS